MIKKTSLLQVSLYIQAFLLLPILSGATGSDCSDPTIISSIPYHQVGLSTNGAGDNYSVSPCDNSYIDGDEYIFTYTPTSNSYITINLLNVDSWTGLHVLDACPDVATNCIASDLDSAPGNRQAKDIAVHAGVTYYIIVSTFPTPQSTDFDIDVIVGNPPAPGTDCGNPLIINNLPFNDLAQNTGEFGDDYSGTGPCIDNNYLNGDDIIYRYTPAANESVSLELTNISGFFTGVQIMDACVDAGPVCIAGGFNTVSTEDLLLENIYLNEGTAYYIIISTWENPQSVTYDLRLTSNRSCEKPINLAITNVTETNATATWQGNAATYDFAYVAAGGDPNTNFEALTTTSQDLTNLEADKTYDVYVRSQCPPHQYAHNWGI